MRNTTAGKILSTMVLCVVTPMFGAAYAGNVTKISVSISDQAFSPSRVVAQLNHPVIITVTNRGAKIHEFAIPYYYIYGENLKPGQSSTIQFTPNTEGTFDMISDPSGTNQPEFKGSFIVSAAK